MGGGGGSGAVKGTNGEDGTKYSYSVIPGRTKIATGGSGPGGGGGGGSGQGAVAELVRGHGGDGGNGGSGFGGGGSSLNETDSSGPDNNNNRGGQGGFGGGHGTAKHNKGGGGGGGAALGGAIFLQEGSKLTIEGDLVFDNNSVTPGTGAEGAATQAKKRAKGKALGKDIFMMSGSTLIFDSDQNIEIRTGIRSNKKVGGGARKNLGGLVKRRSGTLSLIPVDEEKRDQINDYTGTTFLEEGILSVLEDEGLGTPETPLIFTAGGGMLDLADGFSTSRRTILFQGISNRVRVIDYRVAYLGGSNVGGDKGFTKEGTGTLILTGDTNYSGGTRLKNGILQPESDRSLGTSDSDLTFQGGTLLVRDYTTHRGIALEKTGIISVLVGGNALLYSKISGRAGLEKRGAGTLNLIRQGGAANPYKGGTNLLEGTLIPNNDGVLGDVAGKITMNGGTLQLPDGFDTPKSLGTRRSIFIEQIDKPGVISVPGGSATLSGVIEGVGLLKKSGDGTLILGGDNTYMGGTHLIEGVLNPTKDKALGDESSKLTMNGGTLQLPDGFDSPKRKVSLDHIAIISVPDGSATLSGVVDGLGVLTKTGSGTLILGHPSDRRGMTKITEGTLQLTPHQLQSNTDIAAQASLIFDQKEKGSYSGSLSGSGAISKKGLKTLILTHPSPLYRGPITIEEGTLDLLESRALGQASRLQIEVGGILSVSTNLNTFSVIELNGLGQVRLGSNTLEVSKGTFSGIISSSFALTSPGGLTKVGSGDTLTLKGMSTYRGPTIIRGGILDLGSTGRPGEKQNELYIYLGSLYLRDGHPGLELSTLIGSEGTHIYLSDSTNTPLEVQSGTFSGVITGDGSTLNKVSDGTLNLNGALESTFAKLSLQEGILAFSSGTQLGKLLSLEGGTLAPSQTLSTTVPIEVNEPSTLSIRSLLNLTLRGKLGGIHRLTKTGAGILTIDSGSSSFRGELLSRAGILILPKDQQLGEKNLGGVQLFAPDATLIGAGHLGFLKNTRGIVEVRSIASNKMSTLYIDGDYEQGLDAALKVRIAPSPDRADLLKVVGTATLNGELLLDPQPGIYLVGTIYTILEAQAVQNAFIKLKETHPFDFELLYPKNLYPNQDHVQVKILFTETVLPMPLSSLKGNARQIGDYLFSCRHSPSKELTSILQSLVQLTPREFIQGLLQLGPQQFGEIALDNLESNVRIAHAANRVETLYHARFPLSSKASETQSTNQSMWITPLGFYHRQKQQGERTPFHSSTYGFTVGYASFASNGLCVNLGASYTDSNLRWEPVRGKADVQSAYLTPSIGYIGQWGYTKLTLSLAHSFYDVTRGIQFANVRRDARNRHKGVDILGGFVGALTVKLSDHCQRGLFLMPTLYLDYLSSFESSYTEKGAGPLNLSLKRVRASFLRSEFNVKCIKQINRGSVRIAPTLFAGCLVDLLLSQGYYKGHFQEETCQKELIVQSDYSPTVRTNMGVELLIAHPDCYSFKMGYQASWKSDHCVQEGTLSLSWDF